jgi:hypothetical protein
MKKRLLTALALLTGIFLLSASIVCAAPAPVAKTGQTTSYRTGDDGDLKKGVASPNPRFITSVELGTTVDKLTGLMWATNANLGGKMTWEEAIDYANNLSLGGGVDCAMFEDYTDWRLPNVKELQSLIDYGNVAPALPTGHPFTLYVQENFYWSSTTTASISFGAWRVLVHGGGVDAVTKTDVHYVWPVRGGN